LRTISAELNTALLPPHSITPVSAAGEHQLAPRQHKRSGSSITAVADTDTDAAKHCFLTAGKSPAQLLKRHNHAAMESKEQQKLFRVITWLLNLQS
jgi:hypothetical protein